MKIHPSRIVFSQPIDPAEDEQIQKIAASMKEKGQIHPVTVHSVNGSDPTSNPDNTVRGITGRKRVAAALSLGWSEIEVLVRDSSDADDDELALHENLKRANLTWWEEAELEARFHEMRVRKHGSPGKGGRPTSGVEKKGWGRRDTANELELSLGRISESIKLAGAVSEDPRLRNVKDRVTALKLIRHSVKRTEQEMEAALPFDEKFPINDVLCGASAEILVHFPDNVFDGCLTDPPWIEFAVAEREGLVKDAETFPVFKEIFRVLKFDTFLMMFVGFDDFFWYRKNLPKLGFKVSKLPLIWHKPDTMTLGDDSWQYGRNYELVLVAGKGNPVFTSSTQKSGVISIPVVPAARKIHQNEKPLPLIVNLMEDISYEGSLLLDPFGGSGVLGSACRLKNRKYVLIERDHGAYEKIKRRLE